LHTAPAAQLAGWSKVFWQQGWPAPPQDTHRPWAPGPGKGELALAQVLALSRQLPAQQGSLGPPHPEHLPPLHVPPPWSAAPQVDPGATQ
jgi:hypothetical protein